MYIKIRNKFIITLVSVIVWTIISTYIELPWILDLQARFGTILAISIVVCLATLPGIMIVITLIGIILDKPRRLLIDEDSLEDITILIAAYNEETTIYDTIASLSHQYYPKNMYIKIIDNNSKDNTKNEIMRAMKDFPELKIEYLFEKKQGKFAALNYGLATTNTKYVLTFDADSYLYKDAIINISNYMIYESRNKEVAAIAGTVLVRNSRVNLLTKLQEWEYFLSIASIKRMQGLFQSALVAQGAFSIYNTQKVKDVGGWPDSIGEDIVLTWELLSTGSRTYYCDNAICFTNAPIDYAIFFKQRARWARGLVEGLRHFKWKECTNLYSKFLVSTDLFLFAIDFGVLFFYVPGVLMAIFMHDFIIVGPMTFYFLPLTLLEFCIMLCIEYYKVFKPLGLKIRNNWAALIVYIFIYSIILSPACISGYYQELVGAKRKWK